MLVASPGVTAQDLQSSSTKIERVRWTFALSAGVWGSKWQENLSGSTRYVYEGANLPIAAIELIRETDKNLAKFQLKSSSGVRNYEGWTSTGQPITSTSDVEMRGVQAQYQWRLSPDLSWGFRAEHELFRRQLNGIASIRGYLEDYAGFSLLLGGTKTFRFSGGNTLNLAAWFGGGDGHKMTLTLDPYEPSTVKLGNTRQMDVTATWKSPLAGNDQSKWDLIGRLAFTATKTGHSEVGFLKDLGRSAGTFIQPTTKSSGWQASVGIAYTW